MTDKKNDSKKLTAMQQIHEKLGTKNADGILEVVDKQQGAINRLVQTAPIVLTIVINPVTGTFILTNSEFQNTKEDLKLSLSALRKVEDNITQTLFNLVEKNVEENVEDSGEDNSEE